MDKDGAGVQIIRLPIPVEDLEQAINLTESRLPDLIQGYAAMVKHTFAGLASGGQGTPLLSVLTKKPVTPDADEVAANSRSRSAKLRAAERL